MRNLDFMILGVISLFILEINGVIDAPWYYILMPMWFPILVIYSLAFIVIARRNNFK